MLPKMVDTIRPCLIQSHSSIQHNWLLSFLWRILLFLGHHILLVFPSSLLLFLNPLLGLLLYLPYLCESIESSQDLYFLGTLSLDKPVTELRSGCLLLENQYLRGTQVLIERKAAFNQKASNLGRRQSHVPPKPTPKILLGRESF